MPWAKQHSWRRGAARAAGLAVGAACVPFALLVEPPARAEPVAIEVVQDGARSPIAVLANRDDDDRDGVPDAEDERVNGAADERDLAALEVRVVDPRAARLQVSSGGGPLRLFVREGGAWRHAGLQEAELPIAAGAATVTIHVESTAWAGSAAGLAQAPGGLAQAPAGWDGRATLDLEARDSAGRAIGNARAEVQVAPVLLRPATARAREVFVATGRYDNEAFVASLRAALEPLGLPLAVHAAADWREMWMQDTMEIATASIPGSRMDVVLAGLRGADGFPPTLLGPDTAVARVAEPRGLGGGDDWSDWYGNLEVSPPTAAYPAGRAIYGRNTASGESFHPEVVRFLEAQAAQSPVWIDTSWLVIKHVDEIVAFLPGADGRGRLVVPDPEEGLRLARAAGLVDAADATSTEANRRIAVFITEMLEGTAGDPRAGATAAGPAASAAAESPAGEQSTKPARAPGLLALAGWDRDRMIRLPLAFRVPADGLGEAGGVTGAAAMWSNPVNAVLVNGTVICGACDMPPAVRKVCEERFRAAGAEKVVFLDDAAYHRRGGNIHCATNARRE